MIPTEDIDETVAWRRHLHAHPELAYEEHKTSRFVAERLSSWGLTVHTGYGGTGLVGTLSSGTSRRSIAIRADMDALPINETTGLDYRSTAPGRMHACGHDGHVAMLLGAARACSKLADLDGTVHFVFQPAEENQGGARKMVEDGLFRDFPVDEIYAMHNWPALPIGTVVASDDAMMAAFATFEIEVEGRGSHGAMPHEGLDPIPAACAIVAALQSIPSRNVSPLDAAVVSATQIHAGDTWNVIPDRCVIRGTTRWFDPAVSAIVERRICSVAESIAAGYGCSSTTHYDFRYPATINDPVPASRARAVARNLGLAVAQARPSMAAEDFAFMLEAVAGCYLWLGTGRDGDNPGLHSPKFDFNDRVIPTGVEYWLRLVQSALAPA